MKLSILFSFIFLFSNSWGNYTEDEIKQMWTETNINFRAISQTLSAKQCYKSKERFSACLIVVNYFLSQIKKDNNDDVCYQLRVSDTNKLEIIPFVKKDLPESKEETFAFREKLRESYRLFYENNTSADSDSQPPPPIQQHDDLIQQVLELTENIPKKDESYLAGETYNLLLRETSTHHDSLFPLALETPKFEFFHSIGALSEFHETEDGDNGLVIQPVKNSPAESAGLQKGDMILSIDDLDLTKLPHNEQTIDEINSRSRSHRESQVKLKVQKICDSRDHEREIVVPMKAIAIPFPHWLDEKRFVNIDRPDFQNCNELMTPSPSPHSPPESFALYLPLRSFQPTPGGPFAKTPHPLCHEFLHLQKIELENSQSQGILLDLRGNKGGHTEEVLCMLNTLIKSNDLIMRVLPIEHGKLQQTSEEINVTSYYFTEGGFRRSSDKSNPSSTYNKSIVVLVDERSGSASEIFAGTIQEMKRGWVVGERTVGKGITQRPHIIKLPERATGKTNKPKVLKLTQTHGIYTLNSGRSPQGHGIIPDFHVSRTGEIIEPDLDYISPENQLAFDMGLPPILFKNNQWEQNRPDELAQLMECVYKEGRVGEILKQKILEDKRYARLLISDYQLELAKDILKCSSKREPLIEHSKSPLGPFLEKQETIGRIEQF